MPSDGGLDEDDLPVGYLPGLLKLAEVVPFQFQWQVGLLQFRGDEGKGVVLASEGSQHALDGDCTLVAVGPQGKQVQELGCEKGLVPEVVLLSGFTVLLQQGATEVDGEAREPCQQVECPQAKVLVLAIKEQ